MNKPNLPKAGRRSGKTPKPDGPKEQGPAEPVGLPDEPAEIPVPGGEEEYFEEDFQDVDDSFKLATEGMHHAKVIDFEKADSRTGNPQYIWLFRITAGESKDIELRYWTSLLPQARWKVAETLSAVGIEAFGSIARFRKSDIVGKPCIIEVFHQEFEGRMQHKIRKVYQPNKDSIKFAEDDIPF